MGCLKDNKLLYTWLEYGICLFKSMCLANCNVTLIWCKLYVNDFERTSQEMFPL